MATRICRQHRQPLSEDLVCAYELGHMCRPGEYEGAAQAQADMRLVRARAEGCLARARGDRWAATAMLLEEAENRPELWAALVGCWTYTAARQAIEHVAGAASILGPGVAWSPGPDAARAPQPRTPVEVKHPVAREKPARREPSTRGLELVAAMNLKDLLSTTLPGGVPVLQATSEQLLEAADLYGRGAREYATRGRWLRLLAERVPAGRQVGRALGVDEIRRAYLQAQDEMRALGEQLAGRPPLPAADERRRIG